MAILVGVASADHVGRSRCMCCFSLSTYRVLHPSGLLVSRRSACPLRTNPPRAFWFWFSLCGWSYVVLGVSLLEAVEGTTFWQSTRDWLQTKVLPQTIGLQSITSFCAFPFCDMRGVDGSRARDFRARSLRFFNDRESPRWVNSSPGGKARTIGCNRAEYRRLIPVVRSPRVATVCEWPINSLIYQVKTDVRDTDSDWQTPTANRFLPSW